MPKYIGKQTLKFDGDVSILQTNTIVGPKESQGPLVNYFDSILSDDNNGEHSWEKAESKMMKDAVGSLIKKANVKESDIGFILAGDLLNQITVSTFGIKDFRIPFLGVYGACSTIGEGLAIGSMLVDGEYADKVIAVASSHFCSAEKQFRAPLEQGGQRPPTATWTVTGSGAMLLGKGDGPYITHATVGKIIDFDINDAFNMGAVMAPAAADTIINHFMDTGRDVNYYDLIITGDLGEIGVKLLNEMMIKFGYDISSKLSDCGLEIFDVKTQDVGAGGSGCGCSATVFGGYIYDEMKKGKWDKVLFVPTGALLSTLSLQQGENIPGIAYAISIERSKD